MTKGTGIVTIYAVFASSEEAERIGAAVVEEGLAACIKILGECHSFYRWHGFTERAIETPAILKARAEDAEALIARIAALHSYDVPAITVWPVERALGAYADWVRSTSPRLG